MSLLHDARRWWFFTFAVLALGAWWTWVSRVPDPVAGAGRIPSPREGFPAPDFALETLGGDPATLSAYRGQVVILNLWASWCGPCRAEMPAIQRVFDANRDRGLAVLAVNSTFQDSVEDAQAFVSDLGLTFPILLDREGSVSRRYLLRALPSTFFIDRQGVIRSVIIGGPMSEAVLQTKVEDLLNEAP
ncbi:MAG TPA: TlpA disulfide reductase family protein [Anaerolineales bacterium]|nr:TlpA disulfide reductase family protein [Anaerolineales bacterium]